MSGCLSKYDGYTPYMSADTAARCAGINRQIATSITEIEEKSELLRGLKRLNDENRVDQVLSGCEELWYDDKRWDYLQQELKVTFNMSNENVRDREIVDVLFYYLMRDEEPVREIQQLIMMISYELKKPSWYAMSSFLLGANDVIFTQFYQRLGNKPQNVKYLIYKNPQLLFNYYSLHLIDKLNEHLPHGNLHQILLNTRDEKGQTFMFYTHKWSLSDDLYRNKFDDLLKLLSVRNKSGRTVLHVSREFAYALLLQCTTLNNQDKVNELLSISDNNNKTVYDTAGDQFKKLLTWFKRQYEHNNYPLYYRPRVLILYNTNNRSGSENEAESIQQAFQTVTRSDRIRLEKMGTKREVLRLIAQQAANWDTSVLIVCLMSHGNIGTIADSQNNPITLTSIEIAMCSDQLKERPKILITQSCQTKARGIKRTHEGATCSNTGSAPANAFVQDIPYIPAADHFLSVQSCVSGQESTRNVFIPNLAEQIESLAEQIKNSLKDDSFEDLAQNASCKMMREGSEQIPIVQSTLIGNVCLKDDCPECLEDWQI